MSRRRFDPADCVRHLAAHKQAFHIGDSAPLKHFEALIGEAKSCSIECSCKVEGGRVHPARFNLWFQERAAERHLAIALRFMGRVEASEGVALDYGPFRQFYGADFDWSRTEMLVVGMDLRENKSDPRLKIWFKLGQYPEKEDEVLLRSGRSAELRPLMVRPGFLVGFDFHLDGRTTIKPYTRIEQADLTDRARRARLAGALPPPVLARMDECSWAYASLALDGCGRILHFRPTHPESFIPSILGGDTATSITEHYRAESVLDTVVSVRERDLLASRVQDFNLYFMLGAAPPRWASAVATT